MTRDDASSKVPDPRELAAADIRLVVADMDGTLLDDSHAVPAGFWPVLEVMQERGIAFAPASGRQSATLAGLFDSHLQGMALIAENGSYVVRDGAEVSSATIDREVVVGVVEAVRAAVNEGYDLGVVVCGKRSAYIERTDKPFREECDKYYVALREESDVLAPDDDVLKVAIFDFGSAVESVTLFTQFERLGAGHQVVVSGQHWIDIMAEGVNKGAAVRALQAEMGITRDQTAVFGDYFNDAEMLDEAHWSFAMANAHPGIKARANYLAPSSSDGGVVTVLQQMLAE
ncbi:MAG: Cof-type HAD-IIB family hydrolase [Dermatophilus congolensis]|nr:Cof-type HAD-IIB family hydrolase [Dermatophilus congolensis]